MTRVTTQFTMSLDGFVADPQDDVQQLLKWYVKGDAEFKLPGMDRAFRISRASAELLQKSWGAYGSMVTGRRDFDVSRAWGGQPPLPVPMFIVTHQVPQEWAGQGSPFTFVTDGLESALAQARQAAGDGNVAISGTTIVQQCLQAGLLDDIQIDLVPILLGEGIRLFDRLGPHPIALESTGVIEGTGVTHLKFRVVK
jgi:dihydrofolate reductase